jgi:hypothetical protein
MALPLLLMITALIVVFGTAASWKIRTETVSRDAMWRARWPRQGHYFSRPANWPSDARLGVSAGAPFAQLDDGALNHPVARGPLPAGIDVNSHLLDFSRGARRGTAQITRDPPMFGALGPYRLTVENALLEDRFQYGQMGFSRNRQRRMPRIYNLPPAPGALVQAYERAVRAFETSPHRATWRVLDQDDEFLAYYGWAPDFHPRMASFSSLDMGWVEERRVRPLTQQIERVPQRMARAFLRLYQDQLNATPPPPPAVQSLLQQRIDALQQYLATLSAMRSAGPTSEEFAFRAEEEHAR